LIVVDDVDEEITNRPSMFRELWYVSLLKH